ncbi:zf-HC2 domain-containing protein [Streptomyces sp. NPDC048297]|uniref:zf-HC2 domain-containing protein n=1 Tax=Streptomyces sp. NPDC048297 TaxID=3365531 RepID=UPI003716E302
MTNGRTSGRTNGERNGGNGGNGGAQAWHATGDLAARYADGSLPEPDAWSLEKHLEFCASCASRVSAAVRGSAAGPVLAEVRDAVLREALPRTTEERASVTDSGTVSVPDSVRSAAALRATPELGPAGLGPRAAGPWTTPGPKTAGPEATPGPKIAGPGAGLRPN